MSDEIGLDEQIKEVKREIGMRERVYRGQVAKGSMPEAEMTRKIATMRAVLATLEGIEKTTRKQGSLDLT